MAPLDVSTKFEGLARDVVRSSEDLSKVLDAIKYIPQQSSDAYPHELCQRNDDDFNGLYHSVFSLLPDPTIDRLQLAKMIVIYSQGHQMVNPCIYNWERARDPEASLVKQTNTVDKEVKHLLRCNFSNWIWTSVGMRTQVCKDIWELVRRIRHVVGTETDIDQYYAEQKVNPVTKWIFNAQGSSPSEGFESLCASVRQAFRMAPLINHEDTLESLQVIINRLKALELLLHWYIAGDSLKWPGLSEEFVEILELNSSSDATLLANRIKERDVALLSDLSYDDLNSRSNLLLYVCDRWNTFSQYCKIYLKLNPNQDTYIFELAKVLETLRMQHSSMAVWLAISNVFPHSPKLKEWDLHDARLYGSSYENLLVESHSLLPWLLPFAFTNKEQRPSNRCASHVFRLFGEYLSSEPHSKDEKKLKPDQSILNNTQSQPKKKLSRKFWKQNPGM